jgi:DNA-binding transcriptional MerR regulator
LFGKPGGIMAYSITDLSKQFNLPASTIRYYEKIGLLENVEHVNSRRFYNDSHIDRLNAIECFKKALLPLDEIKLFFAYEKDMETNSEMILDMMKTQESKTIESMEALQAGLDHLQKKIRFYTLVSEAVKNKTPLPSWNDV